MKPLLLLIAGVLLAGCATPRYKTPAALVSALGCDPGEIAAWAEKSVTRRRQQVWLDSETCMAERAGDQKCFMAIVHDALLLCPGYDSKIIVLQHARGVRKETVILYIDDYDRRGVIRQTGENWLYERLVDWKYIIRRIPGGPWIEEYAGIKGAYEPAYSADRGDKSGD